MLLVDNEYVFSKFYTDLSKKYLKNVCIKYINVKE